MTTTYQTTVSVTRFESQSAKGGVPCVLKIFISEEGKERPGADNIIGDFIWRRFVNMDEYAKDPQIKDFIFRYMQEKISPVFKDHADDFNLVFSSKAGCSCPCSPGLIVRRKPNSSCYSFENRISYVPSLHLTVKREIIVQAETKAA